MLHGIAATLLVECLALFIATMILRRKAKKLNDSHRED